MKCRVGITTDVARRKNEHKAKYPTLKNWNILASGLTRKQAQDLEDKEAAKGCDASAGGRDAGGSWSVYKFNY